MKVVIYVARSFTSFFLDYVRNHKADDYWITMATIKRQLWVSVYGDLAKIREDLRKSVMVIKKTRNGHLSRNSHKRKCAIKGGPIETLLKIGVTEACHD
jgi:hypothetical protein